MRRKLFFLLILIIMSQNHFLWAYDGKVHIEINNNATEFSQLNSILKNHLGMDEGIKSKLKKGKIEKRIKEWIAYGGAAEDYGKWGGGDKWYNVPCTRGYNHFHDPLKNWDEAGFDKPGLNDIYWLCYGRYPISSILWGLDPERQDFPENTTGDWSWQKSREYYYNALTGTTNAERDENFAYCFRALGQVMHLLQDASVPLHTRNDFHTPVFYNFETYTLENKKFLNYSAHPPDPVLLNDPQPQSNYSYLVPITGLFDRNQYNEGSPIPVNNNILGLAEYSNANFLTEDTMWDYQHPSLADTNYDRIDWLNPEPVDAEDGKTDNRIYIKKDVGEQIDHLAAIKYWAFQLMMFYTPEIHYDFYLDEKCWKDYADKLIPRAIGYSAELLDYFFRGEIDMVPDDEAGFGYMIVNKTEEDMAGTFELYYDNSSDQRIQWWTGDFTLGTMSSGNNESSNIDFTAPDDAKEPGKYILVFRGGLGNETDAVVGKVVDEPPSFWEPWGDTLCANNDGWRFVGYSECELPTSGVTLADGILSVSRFDNNTHSLRKSYDFIPIEANLAPREIRIKIAANASGSYPPSFAFVYMQLEFMPTQYVDIVFAINHWDPSQWEYPPTAYVGDNGGNEQIVTLSDYFTIPEDSCLARIEMFCSSGDIGHSANYDWDYIEISGKCIPW